MGLQNNVQKIVPVETDLTPPPLEWYEEVFSGEFNFDDAPVKDAKKSLSLIEKLEESYKKFIGDVQKRKLYFDSSKYANLPQPPRYNFRATFKTSRGWETKKNLSQKLLNELFDGLGEKSAENRTELRPEGIRNGIPVGVSVEVAEDVPSEEEVGFIVEVYNSRQSLNLMRVDGEGGEYVNSGKKRLKFRKEIRYDGESYFNAYTFRGKVSEFRKFGILFGSNIKKLHVVKSNKRKTSLN